MGDATPTTHLSLRDAQHTPDMELFVRDFACSRGGLLLSLVRRRRPLRRGQLFPPVLALSDGITRRCECIA